MPQALLIGNHEEFAEGLGASGGEIVSAPGIAHREHRAEMGLRPGG